MTEKEVFMWEQEHRKLLKQIALMNLIVCIMWLLPRLERIKSEFEGEGYGNIILLEILSGIC